MSRKIGNGTLEQPMKRKTTILDQRLRTRARVAVQTAMPKEASKRATGNTIQKRRPVRTRAVGKKYASAAATVTIDEITPDISIKPRQELPQEIAVHAEVEAPPAVSHTPSQDRGLTWGAIVIWLAAASNWVRKLMGSRQSRKRLRVCETVSLGDKRFVAVIEVDGEQFLVGGASNSVATLARLAPSPEFSEVLSQRWAQDPMQA
jgi:flagellar biogenesis protein FliO